jgi:alpha-1,3-rhamnosyltransferase
MTNINTQPLVTVVIPCYNHAQYVQDSITSVINQTYTNIELIIIDDGSKDNSVEKIQTMISQCQERFVRFEFRHRENKGLCNTLNEALKWTNGEYFCTLASDDMMLPEKTSLQVEAFQTSPDTVSVCGGRLLIDNENNVIESDVNPYREYTFKPIFMHRFNLPASSQMTLTRALHEVQGFNPNTKTEDWDLWLKLTKKYQKIIYIPHALIYYRSHDTNISKNLNIMYEAVMEVVKDYQNEADYALAVYRIQKQYKVRPYQKTQPIRALVLRLKYYLNYLTSK